MFGASQTDKLSGKSAVHVTVTPVASIIYFFRFRSMCWRHSHYSHSFIVFLVFHCIQLLREHFDSNRRLAIAAKKTKLLFSEFYVLKLNRVENFRIVIRIYSATFIFIFSELFSYILID